MIETNEDKDFPLICVLESPEFNEICSSSDPTGFLKQSFIATEIVIVEPALTGLEGENSEYQKFGIPDPVVQFGLPELGFEFVKVAD